MTMDCSVYSEWQAVVALGSLESLRAELPSMPPFRIVRLVSCNSKTEADAVSARTRHYGDECARLACRSATRIRTRR
jgi:hypothetical protein